MLLKEKNVGTVMKEMNRRFQDTRVRDRQGPAQGPVSGQTAGGMGTGNGEALHVLTRKSWPGTLSYEDMLLCTHHCEALHRRKGGRDLKWELRFLIHIHFPFG